MTEQYETQASGAKQQRKNKIIATAIVTTGIALYTGASFLGGMFFESYSRKQQPVYIEDGRLTDKVNGLTYDANQVPAMYTLTQKALDRIVTVNSAMTNANEAMDEAKAAYDNLFTAHAKLRGEYDGLKNTMKVAQKNIDNIVNYDSKDVVEEDSEVEVVSTPEESKTLNIEGLLEKGKNILGN